jgi:hypothetical protein
MSSADRISDIRLVNGFNKLNFKAVGKIELSQADKDELVIEADRELCSRIKTEVIDDILIITQKGDWLDWIGNPFANPDPIVFHVKMKNITSLSLSGPGTLVCPNITGEVLQLTLSGPGVMTFSKISVNSVKTDLSGVGSVQISGETDTQIINLSGAGNYKSNDLQSNSAKINLSGVGNATIWAKNALDVQISGAGSVEYLDHPQITKKISGIGMLKYIGDR